MPLKGLSKNTEEVLKVINKYKELKQYYLVGGTGLSIRIEHRLSEDLDLFFFPLYPGSKQKLPYLDEILNRFNSDFKICDIKNADKYDVKLFLDGVKIDLHSENNFKRGSCGRIGTIRHPTTESLLGMKITALHQRNAWRDVYDLYCLREKYSPVMFYKNFCTIVPTKYCGGKENRKRLFMNTMAKLENEELLKEMFDDDNMAHLNPVFDITPINVLHKFNSFREDFIEQMDFK
jgi:hypothetical protein